MTEDREARIRKRAYEIWQKEGSPDGIALDHWIQAQQDVDAELSNSAVEEVHDPDAHGNRPPPQG